MHKASVVHGKSQRKKKFVSLFYILTMEKVKSDEWIIDPKQT